MENDFDKIKFKIDRQRDSLNKSIIDEQNIKAMQSEIDQWLTDIEIKLINLQPYASDDPNWQQISAIQV